MQHATCALLKVGKRCSDSNGEGVQLWGQGKVRFLRGNSKLNLGVYLTDQVDGSSKGSWMAPSGQLPIQPAQKSIASSPPGIDQA